MAQVLTPSALGLYFSAPTDSGFNYNAPATMLITRNPSTVVASGSVSSPNMKISGVAGTAFIDFTAANVLTNNQGKYLKVTDSAGKSIAGWIGSAGTGETYTDLVGGTNPNLNNGDFQFGDSGWTKSAGWSIVDSGGGAWVARNDGQSNGIKTANSVGITSYSLTKVVFTVSARTSGSIVSCIEGATDPNLIGPQRITTGTFTNYYTPGGSITGKLRFLSNTAFVGDIDNANAYKVLTPSSTGATITATAQGGAQSWEIQDAAFNYNDTSYTYQVLQ